MGRTFEQGKDDMAALVKHFTLNREAYRENKEAHTRQGLIDPLFAALGWDVHNAQRAATPGGHRHG